VAVPEAARILGISPEAVRARIQRGTLAKDKDPDGTVYVRLKADRIRSIDSTEDAMGDQSAVQRRLVANFEEQVSFLRAELVTRNEELRRKDHIIAALTERIPELPAPTSSQEAPEGRETGSETAAQGDVAPPQPTQRRSWLYRFFFGP